MRSIPNKLAITLGDPAGVGPELIAKIVAKRVPPVPVILYAEEEVLTRAFSLVGVSPSLVPISSPQEARDPGFYLIDLDTSLKTLEPSVESGRLAISSLARATVDAITGTVGAILTMPISKYWAKRAGFSFPGQTEYLAKASAVKDYAMLMYSSKIRVVLVTIHEPLKEAIKVLSEDLIFKKGLLAHREFERLFGKKPKIGVLGLNPHAGEGGDLGREEIEIIKPAVEKLKSEGVLVEGPLPPDGAFLRRNEFDLFLCMYHDQGLIPFKVLAFNEGVNLTLGLPFVRVSPAHGTAYDIAWKGKASDGPSLSAFDLAVGILSRLSG